MRKSSKMKSNEDEIEFLWITRFFFNISAIYFENTMCYFYQTKEKEFISITFKNVTLTLYFVICETKISDKLCNKNIKNSIFQNRKISRYFDLLATHYTL